MKQRIEEKLDDIHQKRAPQGAGWTRDFNVSTQEELISSYDRILSILNALVLGIALVALSESGIGVSNIMYISVKERTREIGVRLAQGASKRDILTQFLIESTTLCVIGAVVGVPLGLVVSVLVDGRTDLPAKTPLWGVVVAFGAALLVGIAAGVYPAWKATQADIGVALRAE